MTKLETVYVPAGAYAKYSDAYKTFLPSTARLKSIGAAGDFQIDDGVLTAYFGDGGEVAIPDTVTEIGTSAFQNCAALTKVSIPGSVRSIGSYAFSGCTGLTEIAFSTGLDKIGSYAFSGCTSLNNVALSEGLTRIDSYAFSGCTALNSVALPEGLTSIGGSAFYGCTALNKLTLPATLTSIGNSAFSGCTGLTGGLTIPGNVSSIGDYAFSGCTGLDGKLIIEAGTSKTIGQNAFRNCSKLTGLVLGDGITSIGSYAFQSCSGLKGDLTIPDKLTAINEGVFSGMSGITSIVIGESVTSIYTYSNYYYDPSFYGMSGVTEVTFLGLTVPTVSHSSYSPFGSMTKLETVYVPAGAYDAYVAAYSQYAGSGVTFSSDTLHTRPGNMRATWCGSKSATLGWNAHGNDAVIGYRIERDGVLVGTTDDCTFTDRQLTAGTTYTYTVYGYTADGATTGKSEISITPQVPKILDIKTGNTQNKLGGDQDTVYIHVQDSKNLRPKDGRTVAELYCLNNGQRCLIGQGTLSETLGGAGTAVYTVQWDVSNLAEGDYDVVFCLTDADGTQAEYSKTLAVDHSRPAQM